MANLFGYEDMESGLERTGMMREYDNGCCREQRDLGVDKGRGDALSEIEAQVDEACGMRYIGLFGYSMEMYRDQHGGVHGYERRPDGRYTHVMTAGPYRTDDGMWDI